MLWSWVFEMQKFRPIGFNDPEELSFLAVFIIGDCYYFSRTIRLLGFVVATIAYQLFPTYKHGTLFVGSAL